MGILTQLGLLFKKNFILRKRQPGIIVLEIVWPVLIIAVVAIIRQGVPIGKRDTCHFQERAMPSAGVVPFLQTFVCNLDNQCHSTYTLNRAKETTNSVSKLVQQLAPTLSSNEVLEGLDSMEKGADMLDALINMANDSDVFNGLDSMLKLRSFFRDPNYVKEVLVARYKVMDEEQVEAMLDSTVNITQIFDLIGYPDFRGVACDPVKLSQFLLFKPSVDVRDISASICNISINQIPDITDFLQGQFDIAQLVRIMGKFERLKQRLGQPYKPDEAFSDVADMIDLALKSPTLIATVKSISSLRELPDLIRNLPNIINKFKSSKFQFLDMAPLVRLVHIIDPVVEEFKPNDTIWYAVKYGILMATEISDLAQNRIQNGSMSDAIRRLLTSAQMMGTAVQQLLATMGHDLQIVFGALAKVEWMSIYDQFFNKSLDIQSTVKSLKDLQATLQQLPAVWEITAPFTMVFSRFLEMGNIVLEETSQLESTLMDFVNKAGPTQTALTTLFNKGPNITMAMLTAFTDSKALAKLFESPFSYQAFCNNILDEVSNMTSPEVVAELRPVMCNDDISTSVNKLITSLRIPEVQSIMNDTTTKLLNVFRGQTPTADANFTMLFLRVQEMAHTASSFVNISSATWKTLVTNFRLQNIDLSQRQWEPVLDRLDNSYVASGILAMVRGMGVAMDSGNLSPQIGQYIHMANLITKYIYYSMESAVDLYSPTSPLGQLMNLMTTYAPELLQAMSSMAKNTQQMREIVSMSDPMAGLCTWIQKMPVPSYVPLDNMTSIICTKIPKVFNNLMASQNHVALLTQQLSMLNTATVYSVDSDWTQIMDYTERMVDMVQQPDNIMTMIEGPGMLISMMNFSRIGEAMTELGNIMKYMTVNEMSSMVDINLAVMRQLDASFQNNTQWRAGKHIILVINSYLALQNHYYSSFGESTSLSQYLSSYPQDIQNYVNNMAAITPDFLDVLKNAVLNPEKLIKKLLDSPTDLVAPDCSTHWVSDFLMVPSNSSVRDFERMTCAMNWTAVAMDLADTDPYMKEYQDRITMLATFDWSRLPDAHVNWTEVMVNAEHYLKYISGQSLPNMTSQYSFAPFNVSAIDMKWTEFVQALQALQNIDMQKLNELMTTVQLSLEKLGMSAMGNMTGGMDNLILNSLYGNAYITHHFMLFANKILTYINTHDPVNLLDYMGSDELRKSVRAMELNPVMTEIGLDTIITYLLDPSKFSVFVNMQDFGMQLCSNVTFFTTVFDLSGTTTDPARVQNAVCSSAAMNYSILYEQLRQNWDGFADFADAVIRLSHDKVAPEQLKINISGIVSDQTTFNQLLNQTIYNPPTILFTTNNDWMNITIYAEQWKEFMHDLNTTLGKYRDPTFMSGWQQSVTKVLTKASLSIPGFDTTLRWMDAILDMVTTQLKHSLQSLPEAFRSYPNLSKILSLVDRLPEAFLVLSFTDIAHPEKVAKWSQAMQSWQTFCNADSNELFATPPGVQFRMDNFLREMCEINITNLAAEMAAYEGTDRLNALLMNQTFTDPVNATAVAAKMASLIDTLTSFSTAPMSTGWDLRIFNESIWMNVINQLAEYLNSTANAYSLNNLQTTLTQTMLSSFQGIPGFNTVFSYMDVILDIITDQIQRSLVSLPEAFKAYPNMYTLLQLLDDIPDVFEVIAYTNLITPQKISKWAPAMQSWEGFCKTDPSTLMTVPPGRSFDLSIFINTMCSINITALAKEAERYQGSDRIAALIASNTTEPVNATAVIAKLTNIINMFTQNASSMVMSQQYQPSAFNESVWRDVFGRISGYLNQTSVNSVLNNLQTTLTQTMLSFQGIPGFNTVFSYMDVILDIIKDQIQRSLVSLPEAFKAYPNMYTLLQLLDDIPNVFEVLAYTNFITPQKISKWAPAMQSWEGFCKTDPSTLMTVPPGRSFDLSVFINTMCSINITALAKEAERYQGSDRLAALIASNTTEPVNATAVIAKLTNIINMFTQNASSLVMSQQYQPSAFNESVWRDVFGRISGYLNQSSTNYASSSIFAMAQNLFGTIPGLQLGGLETVMAVMETILDRIIRLENVTSFAPRDIFPDAPQLQALIDIVEKPGVIPLLLESLNSQKMMPLFAMTNVTEVAIALCYPGKDISVYLSVPPGVTVNIPELQTAFCAINLTALEPEINAAFDVQRITRVAKGDDHVNWLVVGDKFQRVVDLITKWTRTPPEIILPENWENGTYWLDMLNTYNMARQTPDAINAEIKNMLVKMGPLLMEEPFRQYGIVMQTVLRLLNENIVAMENSTMTVTTMFDKVPILKDVITALGLRADVLETLLTAPVRNPRLFTQSLIARDSSSFLCNNGDIWKQLLVLPPSFDTSALTSAVCNTNMSATIANLVRNLDLESLLAGIRNKSLTPDWESIFSQSQELGQNINTLIRNPPTFNVNESLAILEQAYNQSNLWNMVISYNVLAQTFGNSSEFQGVDSYMRGAIVVVNFLNDIFQKMSVKGVTLDLGSLFQGSPTFTRLVNTILHLSPDPITGLASLQLKPSQNQAFAMLASDPNKLAMVFCNENKFHQYFDVAPSFNLSSVLPVLCTMNFTQMVSELDSNFMVSAMIAKFQQINSHPFDIQSYVTAYQQLNNKIMELVGVRNVTFGDTNLQEVFQVNTTALMEVLQQQNIAIQRDYQGYINTMFASLQQSMQNVTEWRTVALSLKIFDIYLKYLNQNLRAISGKPLSLALLVNNTQIGRVLLPMMSDPQWLDQLLRMQLRTDKLQQLLQSPNVSSALCSTALWDVFEGPANKTSALEYLQRQICSMNTTVLMWQSIANNAQGYQFYEQMMVLVNEFQTGSATINLNTTELSQDLTNTVQLVTGFINSLMNSTLSAENFYNVGGFQSVINNLQGTLSQRLTALSNELSNSMLNLIWPQIPDQKVANNMARIINTVDIFMTVINDRLEDIKDGNLTLQTLSGNHPALLSLMEAYINVTKFGLQTWIDGEIHLERVIQLMGNQSTVTARCQAGSVAAFISNSSNPSIVVRNLQTVICTYMTDLPNEFRGLVDYQRIQQEITAIWNSTGSVRPDFAGYTAEIQRFNQLLIQIAQSNIRASKQLTNMFDFSTILKSLNNLANDPTIIFQLLKPIGLGLNDNPVVKQIISSVDTYMVLPIIKYFEILKENGLSFESMYRDPSQLIKAIGIFSNYNTQLGFSVEAVAKPLFENIAKNTGFMTTYLCNRTVVNSYFLPLVTPAMADMFCNDPPTTWINKLTEMGLTNVEMYGLSVKMMTAMSEYTVSNSCYTNCTANEVCYTACTSIASPSLLMGDVTWVQFMSDMEKMTKLFMAQTKGSMNMTSMNAVNSLAGLWESMRDSFFQNLLQSAFGTMKLVDILDSSAQWNGVKRVIHLVGSVNGYLNNMMERFTNSSTQIYLKDVFPDSNQVAKLLAGVVGQDTAAEFLTAAFNPVIFYEKLSDVLNWQTILCDSSQFSATFTFPPGTNVLSVQQAMCRMAQNQSSSLDQLVKLFGAGKVLSEFQSLMSSPSTNMTYGWSLWDTVYNSTIRLLHNLDKLQKVKVNGTSAAEWFAPIVSTLQALQNPGMDLKRTEATCNEVVSYLQGTDMFRQARPVVVEAIGYMKLMIDQLSVTGVADDVVCALTRDLDLNKAIDLLKSAGFWDSLTQSNYLLNFNASEPLQCSALVQTSSDMWTAINKTFMGNDLANWAQIGQCVMNGTTHFRTFLTGIDSVLKVASDLIPILQEPSLKLLLGNQESLAPALEFILRIFTQQRTVLLKFSDLLKKNSTIEMYLLEALRLSPEIVNSLLKSSINLDAVNFLNQPVEVIRDTLCDPVRLGEVLTLPNFTNVNVPSLSRLLCTNQSLETAAALKSAAEATALLEQILTAAQTGLDQAFFNNISTHIFNLVGDMQSISEIAGLFSGGFDLDALRGNIPKIDRFLMSSGPERIVQSLTNILDDIRKVLPPSSEADTVLKEIDIFIRGFIGLDIVQSYFLEALTVVDFLKNPSTAYNYLVGAVGMSPENAKTLLEGVFSIRVFLNSSYLLDEDFVCKEMIDKLILLNTTEMTLQQITKDLCLVNESVAIKIANLLIPQLTIGDLVQRYVSLSADDIFRSVNLTAADATSLATKLSNAQNRLLEAADILTGKSTTLNLKSNELLGELFNLPQAQTGPNTMGNVQPLLCGKKPGDLAGDDFNIGSVLGTNSKATVNKDELEELSKAGGDFCQNMYSDIKNQALGSIIWAYLKPIMRGKIVYTPNTPLSRSIIEQADHIFRTMKEVKRVAKIWSEGAPNLMLMSEKSKKMGNLKDVLKNEFISSLLRQTAGLDTKDLLSGLDALNSGNFNSSSIKGMKVAADLVVNYTSCMEMDRFVAAETEEDLEKAAFKLSKTNNFLAGLVFTNIPTKSGRKKRATDSEEMPKHIQYKIRMESENVRTTSRLLARYWQPAPDDNFPSDLQYLRGFMQLQDMIERAIVAIQTGDNSTLPGVYVKQFPFPCTTHDLYIGVLGSYLLPVVMTFAWLAALAIATRNLVYDRESGHEEALRIMGMKSILNWLAWLISTLILMVIVSAILMMILKVSKLFAMSDPTIIFLYLVCFCVSTTMLCYFVSAFFTRVTLAILTVLIVYFLSYLPYVILVSMEVSMAFWQKSLACLFSTSAFGFAAQYLARLEMQNIGLQWSNIDTSPITGDPMTFSWACYMMLIDSAIYLILGWYIRSVMPGKFGVAEPWYFPVLPSYWCGKLRGKKGGIEARTRSQNVTLFESNNAVGVGGIPGMAVRDLTKKYGNKTVVDNISIDFFEGQVTALLGHNGAAKTTTMNMLIGILQPTTGEVFIKKKGSSGSIGYCPQQNTLLDYMTVMEHMELYSGVKCDWSTSEKANEIRSLLMDVDLHHVRDVRVNQLSGGMKRRLCVALAFVGGSTAVVLDEPTSGVDPHARKHIWNLIVKQRLERTILLSTHHLDEADTLGDTVAIMHKGHILCCGTPIFLKEKLGGGYHLTADKAIRQEADGGYNGNQSNCKSSEVLAFIQSMLPQAQLVEEVGTEMTFNLPREDSATTPFSTFFTELDRNLPPLHINSYGVSDTTLEDVFLKVTALADDGISLSEEVLEKERMKLTRTRSITETESDTTSETSSQETSVNMLDSGNQRYSGLGLKLQQMSALLLKRLHHYRRNWRMLISIILLPTILFLVSMGFAQIRPSPEQMPSLLMTPDLYAPNKYMFYKDLSFEPLSDFIVESLTQKPGLGTACMDGFDSGLDINCDWTKRNYIPRVMANETGRCKCTEHKQHCDAGAVPIPRHIQTPAGNYLQDLAADNIPTYLVNSFQEFIEKRYGGWSYDIGPDGTDIDTATTVWFNNRGYHAMPAFFNAYSNSLLRAKLEQTATEEPEKYGISLYNHPFTFHTMKLSLNSLGTQATDAGIALVFLLAFTFIPTAFMVYLVNENINKEKQLQFISGVGSALYWTTSFLWDLIIYSFTVAIAVAVLAIFRIGPYWDRMNLVSLVVLILLYGWAILPMMYMMLKLFKSASSAYLTLFCLNMLIGILSVIVVFTLVIFQSLGMQGVENAYNVCRYLFLIFPQFCLGQGLIDLAKNHFKYILFIRFGEDTYENPLTFELLGWNLVALGIEGLVCFIITILIESRHGSTTRIPRRLLEIPEEDDDVRNERNRIQIGHTKDDILYINGLTKMYRQRLRKFLAVDNISFGVSKGECFGLLGVNGAGKTTTFRMLTGDTNPSSGDAFLNGNKISTGDPYFGQEVGYCPQEGGLDNYLSGEELLFCHARLKGMSDDYAKKTVTDLVGKLHLAEYAQKAIHTYSGGTKRKLSLAIAMLGEPPVLFLDEPTTGMDPATRRLVWKCITKSGQKGQSIVLTSHSMDECDALCSRLAIMVNGRLMCLGSAQHLKSKFGEGYTVIMHIQGLSSNRYNIEQAFLSRFPGAMVKVSVDGKDQHQSVMEVSIPRGATSVAELFNILQTAQAKNHITRYSLSQTTLDTVFVNFAREQSDSVSAKDDTPTGSVSDQSGTMPGPFTNQTYAYMNPQYLADPDDVRFSPSSQYAANLTQASSFRGDKQKAFQLGTSNEAFKGDEDIIVTRL